MTTRLACGHAIAFVLIGAVTVFINASSAERPLRRYDTALRPLLQTDNPYLLNGVDLSFEGMGAPLPLGQIRREDLSGMDLRKAIFSRHGLHGLHLRGSHLAQANFSCVPLKNVDFSGADLRETRFDFSSCVPPPLPPGRKECPEGTKLLGDSVHSCFTLEADLVGANLSGALLQGKPSDKWKVNANGKVPKPGPCERWLVIQGKLDGARFDQATLRCVALINQSPPSDGEGRPAYSGIRFIQSNLDHLLLESGNFLFSDFWEARVSHLAVNLPAANLRFSTLAGWQCPREGCFLDVISADQEAHSHAITGQLSLNVSGSRIRSNLLLAANLYEWPALMCNEGTAWTSLPIDTTRAASGEKKCSPSRQLVD